MVSKFRAYVRKIETCVKPNTKGYIRFHLETEYSHQVYEFLAKMSGAIVNISLNTDPNFLDPPDNDKKGGK